MGKSKKVGSKSNFVNESGRDGGSGGASSSSKNRHGHGGAGGATAMPKSSSPADLTSLLSPQAWPSFQKYEGGILHWVAGCIVLAWILGYAIGSGWTDFSGTVSPWRKASGQAIRGSTGFHCV
eukprot:CAMPEP_0198155046 /NCGR_PEP_ID=MMETSP1443-20131203/68928_1 /TAXON_ID=186043 /ORGANISM="Entomoneis sp., Strain CCMP2396" /LENGTH=122 /DNA_ID=CAMNT_0043821777 /DNA_START=54 /DNA_END=422 /DNA_ORIENTATION=+